LNKSANALIRVEPPAPLAAHIAAIVHRDENPGRQLVRVLPEVRGSIQIMLAEPYWLRDAAPGSSWRRLPRLTLWGPRYDWCFGFAAGHIEAFGFALTGAGLMALTGKPASAFVNRAIDLADINADLAAALDPATDEPFEHWRARITSPLARLFSAAPIDPVAPTLDILATAESNAVATAAAHAGISERQYRRLFAHYYGVSPKLYQRAIRVDRMLRQLHETPWEADRYADTPIAYADQPHAIREFRALTGITPGDYVRIKRRGGATLRSAPTEDVEPPDF
jgi:AraC-like DNA-binding protein